MYLKDQIRLLVALVILLIIGLTYYISNSQEIAGYATMIGFVIWLALMFFLRKKD